MVRKQRFLETFHLSFDIKQQQIKEIFKYISFINIL